LSWVGDQLIGDRKEAQFPSLARTPDLIAQYLQGYPSYIDQLATLLDSVRSIFLVGRGISLASAGTGGLIIKEAARFPAEGMSSAAFRHGPFEMASPQVFVLVYAGLRQTVDLNERLAAAIRLVGGGAQIVSPEAPFEVFRLASSQPASLPILEILPAQMISLSLAALQGMEPGRFERASKVTTVE
jgi:glucosamine--fructose-6-phosphate aminotransferase (isomerizing)